MTADRDPAELARLVERAAGLTAGKRRAFLDQACAGDAELRAAVEERLAAEQAVDHDAPTLLGAPVADPPAPPEPGGDPYRLTGTRIGHYEIGERLGRGGMGIVYRAHDTMLDRSVALKFILLSLSADKAMHVRFLAEARAASALDHNNICTIHEVGETRDGQVYIAMAYYSGETLAEKIRRGPLTLVEALDYGAQIAAGLTAAHARRIFHRDMKPANVMITEPAAGAERGTAKILDFGLAKVGELQLTRSGTTMGTLAYMSPEQARGEEVDGRADVWSLGVILYEMLTGERPFRGGSDAATLNAVLNDEVPKLRQTAPEHSEELEAVVARCLERDKRRRWATMAELLEELRGMFMVAAGYSGAIPTPPPPPRRRAAAWVAGAILSALLLALAVPASRRALLEPLVGQAVPAKRLVAVLPFVNSLGDSDENRALADGLTHSIAGLLATLGTVDDSLWIVPATEIVQRGVGTAADARKLFGVDQVVTGVVQRPRSVTEITLSLVDPAVQPPRSLGSRTALAPLTTALREAAIDALAFLLGVSQERRERLTEQATSETTEAAFTAYLRGVGYLQRFDQPGALDKAIAAFRESVAEDPAFGAAHAGLCEALWDKYRLTEETELTELALVSCERAGEVAEGDPAVLISIGRIYFEKGEYRKAESELELALEIAPERAEAYRWLGWVRARQGRVEEAEAELRKAIELEPRLWSYYNDLAQILWGVGAWEKAAELGQQALELTPENYIVHNVLGVSRENLNQVDEAERLYRRSAELQPNPMAHRNLGMLYFREQQYGRAVEALEQARDLIADAPSFQDYIVWGLLADAYHWAGEREAAAAAWRRLIEIATPLYEVNPRQANAVMLLAEAHLALGELEQGRHYLSRLVALPEDDNFVLYHVARIYEMLGDRELALSYLARALEARFDPVTIDRDPWLEELRKEPRYQALRQQFLVTEPG